MLLTQAAQASQTADCACEAKRDTTFGVSAKELPGDQKQSSTPGVDARSADQKNGKTPVKVQKQK